MKVITPLRQAWQTYFVFKKHHPAPTWARLLISTGLSVGFAIALVGLVGLFHGKLTDQSWWFEELPGNLVMILSITYSIHALHGALAWLLPADTINRISSRHSWSRGAFFGSLGIAGSLLGGALGLSLISLLFGIDAWVDIGMQPHALRNFLLVTASITVVNWVWWRQRAKQQALQMQATESRLRLLQAQIEPHFLFNTLANVQSLMDSDTPRAKLMLETFTDYLRTSLGQLRNADSTLGAELEMAQSYLLLLQIRMGDRLNFVIEASAQARAAVLPPLLLQPLLENAIHHGLEPKIEGGQVCVRARLQADRLEICVDDDGMGLAAPRRALRATNGLALGNIRERLQTRYGDIASLTVLALPVGTRVLLNIPYTIDL